MCKGWALAYNYSICNHAFTRYLTKLEYTDDYAINIYNATLTFKNHEPLHLTDTIKCTLISVCLLLKEEDFERLII